MNLLMNQINNNWTRPPAIKGYENLIIKIDVYLNPAEAFILFESTSAKASGRKQTSETFIRLRY